MRVAGIDPGQKGAIACLGNGDDRADVMPCIGKEINGRAIMAWLEETKPDLVIIEKVHSMPKQGVSSTFTFGKGYGLVIGIVEAMHIPYQMVTPQAWKKSVLAGTNRDKDAALAFVHRSYPGIDLTPGRLRKPHDGIADAVCIADYGMRVYRP